MNYPKVLISVLNWNNAEATTHCINSIINHLTYPPEFYSIIVLDNNSIDGSFERLKETFPALRVVQHTANRGFAAGHLLAAEIGLKENYDLHWILNNDLVINSETFPALIDAYREKGEGIFGSMSTRANGIVEFAGLQEISEYAVPDELINVHFGKHLSSIDNLRTYWSPQIYGFSMLIPFTIIRKYGFLRTEFFMYHEESEYCFRLLLKNSIKSYIVQKSLVVHETSTSFVKGRNLKFIKDYYIKRNDYLLGSFAFGYKKRSYFKRDFPRIWKLFYLLLPEAVALALLSDQGKRNYFKALGAFHYYIGRLGKTVTPEKYIENA